MKTSKREAWIWLSAVPGIGSETVKKVFFALEKLQLDPVKLSNFSQKIYKQLSLSESQIEALNIFKKSYLPKEYLTWLDSKKIDVLTPEDKEYPFLLKNISNYPAVLYVQGPTFSWQRLPISVVGTRHLTKYGEQATHHITSELVDLGATIVSGFMYGADMEAHLTAMRKKGPTVAILGYGFDYIKQDNVDYPVKELLELGNSVVTEFAPFVAAQKAHFPMRNRIVAGWSHATVVTEAASRSGSLITAQLALDAGRVVCAVPGPYTSIYSEGTKHLINQGAKLVTSGFEVIEEVRPSLESPAVQTGIEELVKQKKCTAEFISEQLHLDLSSVLSRLSMLEVEGVIKRTKGKWWSYI